MRRVILLLMAMAGPLAAQGRPPGLDSLEARARRDSNDAIAHYDLAMSYWGKRRWDEAERSLRTAISIAPSYADAYLALATLPQSRGERYWRQRREREGAEPVSRAFAESDLFYRRAFQLNPLVDLRILGRAQTTEAPVSRPGTIVIVLRPWWEKDFVRAINEFRDARYDVAYQRLSNLMARGEFGGSDEAVPGPILWYHGLASAHTQRYDIAIRDFALLTGRAFATEEQATALGIPLATNDFRFTLATMLYLAGRHAQAIPVFRRTLEFDLGLYVAHVQLARMHEAAGELDAALRERRLAVDVNPEEADPLIDLAFTLLKAQRPADALEALARAEPLNPRDARIPYLRGTVALHLGDTTQGRSAFDRFLAIAPSRMAEQVTDARTRLEATR